MTTHFEKMYINYGIQQTRWFLFFATSTVVSCAQRKRKNMYNAELFEREDFIRQFVKLHPGEIGLSFRMSSLKT